MITLQVDPRLLAGIKEQMVEHNQQGEAQRRIAFDHMAEGKSFLLELGEANRDIGFEAGALFVLRLLELEQAANAAYAAKLEEKKNEPESR